MNKYINEQLSYSSLKAFSKSPNHFIRYRERKLKSTPAQEFGVAFHHLVLQPESFDDHFAVAPKVDKRTKKGKETIEKFEQLHASKKTISIEEMALMSSMAHVIKGDKRVDDFMIKTEKEVHGEGQIRGLNFHGFADILKEGHFVADLKTCRDASPTAFARDAYNMDYHLQAAIYCRLFNVPKFFWIAIEKDEPFNVSVFEQSEDAKRKSMMYLDRLIEDFKNWDGNAGSYTKTIDKLDLPSWA